MPRRARITVAGIPWHIIHRGNNRTACFYAETEYDYFLNTTPHSDYLALGASDGDRHCHYRHLFDAPLGERNFSIIPCECHHCEGA